MNERECCFHPIVTLNDRLTNVLLVSYDPGPILDGVGRTPIKLPVP